MMDIVDAAAVRSWADDPPAGTEYVPVHQRTLHQIADQMEQLEIARRSAARQAECDGLWFVAQTISEATLQHALRQLAAAIEGPNVGDNLTASAGQVDWPVRPLTGAR